jgi:hypothetical protein
MGIFVRSFLGLMQRGTTSWSGSWFFALFLTGHDARLAWHAAQNSLGESSAKAYSGNPHVTKVNLEVVLGRGDVRCGMRTRRALHISRLIRTELRLRIHTRFGRSVFYLEVFCLVVFYREVCYLEFFALRTGSRPHLSAGWETERPIGIQSSVFRTLKFQIGILQLGGSGSSKSFLM